MSSSLPPAAVTPPTTSSASECDKKKKQKAATPSSSSKKLNRLDPTIRKQRREIIETRILKLEGKLTKDRTLLLRYVEEKAAAEITDCAKRSEAAAVEVV